MSLESKNPILTGFTSSILGNAIMFAATMFLTRIFPQETYGEFRLVFAFCSIAALILLAGRDSGIIFFAQQQRENTDSLIKSERFYSFLILLLGSAILALNSSTITDTLFNQNVSPDHFLITCIMIPLWGIFNLNLAALKVKGEINYSFVLQNFTQRALRLPFFASLYFFPKSFFALALSMILSQIVLIKISFKRLSLISSQTHLGSFRDFISKAPYSLQIGLNSFLFILLNKIDVLMVGKFIDNSKVAVYDISVLLAFILLLPFNSLVKSLEPKMSFFKQDKKLAKKYEHNMDLAIILSLAIIIGFTFSGDFFLSAFGQSYVEGYKTLLILSIGLFISSCIGFPVEFLNMNGRAKLTFAILLISVAINSLINLALIPRFGIEGAALATIISLIFTKSIGRLVLSKSLGISPKISLRSKVNISIASLMLAIHYLLAIENNFHRLLLATLVSGIFTISNLYSIYGKFWKHKLKN